MIQNNNKDFYDVIIVGAGAASTYLSLFINKKLKVLVIDKNENILKKFLISGNGKANITNICSLQDLLNNMIFGTKNFMYYAFWNYNSKDILEFLKKLRIDFKQKENSTKMHLVCSNIVFKNKIKDLIKLEYKNIFYKFNEEVISTKKKNDLFEVKTNKNTFWTKSLVLATGGISFSKYSKNSVKSYNLAKSFDHTICKLFPMGFSFILKKQLVQFNNLSGNSFKQIECSLIKNNKIILTETNDLMITHNGLGGPIIRRISGYFSFYESNDISLKISLVDKNLLISMLNRIKKLNELFKELNWFPKRFIQNFYNYFSLNPLSDVKNFKNSLKENIINYFCHIMLNFTDLQVSFSFEPAINTGGGVNTKEINPQTFESKKISNLYFIGELIDVNAKTGGFNLTLCFSSAKCCAIAINNKLL